MYIEYIFNFFLLIYERNLEFFSLMHGIPSIYTIVYVYMYTYIQYTSVTS